LEELSLAERKEVKASFKATAVTVIRKEEVQRSPVGLPHPAILAPY
jgi:hypothetical protein